MREDWSPEAATLSASATAKAAQPGGMGVGPRLTVDEVFGTFRVLNLAEKQITTVSLFQWLSLFLGFWFQFWIPLRVDLSFCFVFLC